MSAKKLTEVLRKFDVHTSTKTSLPPSRIGKKALTVHVDPDLIKQLKHLAIAKNTSLQALITQTLTDLIENNHDGNCEKVDRS